MFALAIPTQAKMPTPRITHPQTSYQKSVSFFFFLDCLGFEAEDACVAAA
jgi:hypothetical protein